VIVRVDGSDGDARDFRQYGRMLKRDLDRLLRDYRPIDALDAGHHRALIELARGVGDCFSRAQFEPGHVTASAFVLDPNRERLALILHKKLGRWLQPGGHVEPTDDDLESAARREVLEEIGLDRLVRIDRGAFDVDVHEIPARREEPRHHHFDVRFAFAAVSVEASAASDEVSGFRWVALSDLEDDPTVETDESVLRAARKLRAVVR
jgi:8-oxo-dGTP pyrophosphatase MutT (NUDIX family)